MSFEVPYLTSFGAVIHEELDRKRSKTISRENSRAWVGNFRRQGTYEVAATLLLLIELRTVLVDAGAVIAGIATESDVEVLEESVAASQQRFGLVGMGVDTGLAVKDNDSVGKVGGHDEIVLDNEGRLLSVHDEALDDARSNDTLLGVEIGRGLIDKIDIGRHSEGKDDGNTLQFTARQILDFLVNKVIEFERLDDVGLELGRQEHGPNLLEKELANSAVELGGDGLGFHADGHLGNSLLAIRLKRTCQETTEGGLASTVLAHHDDDFGISKATSVDVELEVSKSLLHGGVLERARLVGIDIFSSFRDAEGKGLVTETKVLGGNVAIEEDVDAFTDGVRQGHNTIDGRLAVEHANIVGEVVKDGQIVLNNDDVVVGAEE